MLPAYAELHCLSNFTFLRGASHPEELVERAHALGYSALALTDECSLAGIVRAHLAAKSVGLPLVVGSEFTLEDGRSSCCSPPTARPTATSRSSITRGRRSADKGTLCAVARRRRGAARRRCLALWLPGDDATATAARWFADVFAGRAWIARWSCSRAPAIARGSTVSPRWRATAACRSSPRATSTCMRARGARCRTR